MFLPIKVATVLLIAFFVKYVGTQNAEINIPLSKPITWDNKELYSSFIHLNRLSAVSVKFSDLNKNVSFIIFQVHSHIYNVTLYNNTLTTGSYVIGRNIGMYSSLSKVDNFFIFNNNENVDLDLLIAVHGYREKDPVPGGCNMEFPIPVSPFMNTEFQKDIIQVDASPAKYYDDSVCNKVDVMAIDFYLMYLPERDFGADAYFAGLKKMMTLENIRNNGDKIPQGRWPMSHAMSAYPGTGAVYVVVASNKYGPEFYSVYVPSCNYACSLYDDENCELIDDNISRIACASLLFVGLFVCYLGHRFFKTGMFLFGLLSGVVITYIIMCLISNLDRPALVGSSLLSGSFFGAIWLTFWWYYGIPVIAVSLPALNLGFLMSAIIYNQFPGDIAIVQEDFNFWTLFIMIMLLVSLILVSVAFISNIWCCAVLGAYATIYPIDFYLGSNLKYIVINTIRRATVPKFNRAVLMPPFGWRDTILVVSWVALAVSGFMFQHYHNRGRPPFPPPPRSVRPGMPEQGYGALPTTRNRRPITVATPVIVRTANETTGLLA